MEAEEPGADQAGQADADDATPGAPRMTAPRATVDELVTSADSASLDTYLAGVFARPDRGASILAVLSIAFDGRTVGAIHVDRQLSNDLVVEITRRLDEVIGVAGLTSRLPGGEFVVVLDDLEATHHAANVADRILDAFRSSTQGMDDEVRSTVSIGIGFLDDDGVAGAVDLLAHARTARQRAHDAGGDRYEVFDETTKHDLSQRLQVREELYDSIDAGDFLLHYQPIADFTSGAVTMVEALVRWEHPTRGLVAAGEFINLAEEHGLILPLGVWVLNEACEQLHQWLDTFGDSAPVIAVNFSAQQFHHPTAVMQISGVVEANDIDPRYLCIELSESMLMADPEASIERLRELKGVGVSLSIDHFGLASSAFSHLRDFPVDLVKIDRSFIDGIDTDAHHEAVAKAIIVLARSLDLSVGAEGIETTEQFDIAHAIGCDHAQGYHVGRPQPPADVVLLLTGHPVAPTGST